VNPEDKGGFIMKNVLVGIDIEEVDVKDGP
jgi:hypothetical protein